eukprot:1329502-Heterocapsa_arctica.AAC.1
MGTKCVSVSRRRCSPSDNEEGDGGDAGNTGKLLNEDEKDMKWNDHVSNSLYTRCASKSAMT